MTEQTVDQQEQEDAAIDALAKEVGHDEPCHYTLKATTQEIREHLAQVGRNGGPLPSCGI